MVNTDNDRRLNIPELLDGLKQVEMSQGAIARAIGVSRATVRRWREGVTPHNPERVGLLLRGLLVGEFEARQPGPDQGADTLTDNEPGRDTDGGNIFDRLREASQIE